MVCLASNKAINGNAINDTHVSVEIKLNKKCVIEDPTFNVE